MGIQLNSDKYEDGYDIFPIFVAPQLWPAGGSPLTYAQFVAALMKEMGSETLNTLHAAVGIAGEAGELLDAVKKHWAYGKPLDLANVKEELGDMFFYMTALMIMHELTLNDVIYNNSLKLADRYKGLVYSDDAAIARADKVVTGETTSSGVIEEGVPQAINSTEQLTEELKDQPSVD